MDFNERIKGIFSKYDIDLSSDEIDRFHTFFDMLVEANKSVNLTSITEMEEVIIKHFLDSTVGAKYIEKNAKVLDIGCGAGFPSLPIKIVREDIDFTLVDSVSKKLNFVDSVISSLSLDKISTLHTRIEDFAKSSAGQFDVVICRAVAPLPTLLEYALPFLKVGGVMMAYKGQNVDEEILSSSHALEKLHGEIEEIKKYDLEGNTRCILIVKKLSPSPNIYPRPRNLPRIKPL